MDARLTVPALKRKLLEEVGSLCDRNGPTWKEPIVDVLQVLRDSNVQAVLFGGTLRSLLVSRIYQGRLGRPRDIDVVVSGASLSWLERRFHKIVARRTRFGGLQLRHGAWRFDVWPVGETWAFKHDRRSGPADFRGLPTTTTFNLEAIAVEVWSCNGGSRALFSHNDQFFDGILARTIELNRIDSPFPELTVVRALILACELQFDIGPRLVRYIRKVGAAMSEDVVERVQTAHYGHARMGSRTVHDLIATIAQRSSDGRTCRLPVMGQLQLWPGALNAAGSGTARGLRGRR